MRRAWMLRFITIPDLRFYQVAVAVGVRLHFFQPLVEDLSVDHDSLEPRHLASAHYAATVVAVNCCGFVLHKFQMRPAASSPRGGGVWFALQFVRPDKTLIVATLRLCARNTADAWRQSEERREFLPRGFLSGYFLLAQFP